MKFGCGDPTCVICQAAPSAAPPARGPWDVAYLVPALGSIAWHPPIHSPGPGFGFRFDNGESVPLEVRLSVRSAGFPGFPGPPARSASFIGIGHERERKAEPPPELTLTFGTTPIIAWRSWKLEMHQRRDGGRELWLAPIGNQISGATVWTPGRRMEAVCTGRSHDLHKAPWPTCQCGIWGLRTREEVELRDGQLIYGSVALWGRVLEFEKGYRAQYAYPQELFVAKHRGPGPGLQASVGEELGRLYGVPVRGGVRPFDWAERTEGC